MGYVGNPQATAFSSKPAKQDLTGASGTSLTLSHAVANAESISLFINNVRQEPTTAYSVSGTAVTLTGSVVASDDIYVIYNSLALQEVVPPDGSVGTAKLADGSVTATKLASGVQGVAGITTASTSGTAMNIDSSNRLTMPLQPSFRAIGTTNSFATTSPIPFPSVQHNIGSHFSTSSNEFTVPIAGVYSFHAHIGYIAVQSNAGNGQVDIRVNNVAKAYSYTNLPAATGYIPCSVSLLIQLAVNDVVKVQFNANGSASYYGGGVECQFSGYLVGQETDMALSKIQSESVNLADNFAFTGTITGAGGGKTLQMVRAAAAPRISGSISSMVYTDTGVTASITPSSSSSKILILAQINLNVASANYHFSLLKRSIGGSAYATTTGTNQYGNTFEYKAGGEWLSLHTLIIDEPATTSAITYKIYYAVHGSTTWNFGYNGTGGNDNGNSLILLEIGAQNGNFNRRSYFFRRK